MREAVRIAEGTVVALVIESEVTNVVHSPETVSRLLDEIGSPHLRITMDAANLFHESEFPRMAEAMDNAFALQGNDIVLADAKDISRDGEAGQLLAGQGLLDYDRYISLLKRAGFCGPRLRRGLPEDLVGDCVSVLRKMLAR